MVFGFFKKRDGEAHKKIEHINKSLSVSFSNLRKDMNEVGNWITHFKDKHEKHDDKFEKLHKRVDNIEKNLEEMKAVWTRVQTAVQTGVQTGQTRVQTRVGQTDVRLKQMSVKANTLEKLKNLTFMEKGIVWILLNSDAKMSYHDLFITLGKDKSTLRGQINNIKLKSPGLIKEFVENDGTKRFYIDEKAKSEILNSAKKVEVISPKEKKRRK